MKIAIGSDHAGFELKEYLRGVLEQSGHSVEDYGAHNNASSDYPDYAAPVARAVAQGQADYGVLVCMTGMGMAIAANKIHGIRAALAFNPEEVGYTRKHNNANVLTLSSRYTTPAEASEMVQVFLGTGFEGGERHERRINKVMALEREN
jgi:ribose 5-phosphate isomerase B